MLRVVGRSDPVRLLLGLAPTMAMLIHSSDTPPPRQEMIQSFESSKVSVLALGVELRMLVGAHNGARNLFTGVMTLAPGASYPYYVRPFSEALVLLDGEAAVDVEDRRYRLGRLDAVSVAPQQPRRVANLSTGRLAVLHLSLASAVPDQTWVNGRYSPIEQPATAIGRTGSERLCRNDPAARFELAPRALFQDLFRVELGTRAICGGYGVFEPGARLPCHRHEFDESITIVEGVATCVVEGRRHDLSGKATALVPEGRCHYFINLTLQTMTMVWVYAGDRPDRVVVDESFCNPGQAKSRPGGLG
jgi:quercetin dioxygenase-like cupin family protein